VTIELDDYTHNSEVRQLRRELEDAILSAEGAERDAGEAESELSNLRERCNLLAREVEAFLTSIGAMNGKPATDPLEFAIGSTTLEKVADLARNLVQAHQEYEESP